jgi:hypothetical protein
VKFAVINFAVSVVLLGRAAYWFARAVAVLKKAKH